MRDHRPVTPLLASVAVSVVGDGAFLTAVPLLAATLTSEPLAVSAVAVAAYLPWLLVGLPVGALVDRRHRRTVMMIADLLRAALLGLLTTAVLTERVTITLLMLTVALVATAQTFFDSAAEAFVPSVIGRDRRALARINGRLWIVDTAGRSLFGPPLGSLTFALAPVLPFVLNAVSFLSSAVFVRRLPQVPAAEGPHDRLGIAIRVGMRHLVDSRELLRLAMCVAAYNMGYHLAMATFVLYATVQLRLSPALYGVILAGGAVGGIVAGWFAGPVVRALTSRQVMALTMTTQALGWLVVAAVARPWLVAAILPAIGGCGALASVAIVVARQELTPDTLLGRVVTTFRFVGFGGSGLGALAGGLVAERHGLTAPLVVAGTVLLILSLAAWPRRTPAAGRAHRT